MTEETSRLQLTARELQLVLKYGYPFPEEAELLGNRQIRNGMHVAHVDPYWISMWIADIVRSAKEIRSQGLLEGLDVLCEVPDYAEHQNTRVRGLALE